MNQLNPFQILMAWIVVKFKRTDDILQGISKLDYLLKVSYFQRYKTNINLKELIEQDDEDIFNSALLNSEGLSITSSYLNN
jgi:hypothetical protein